MEHSFEITPEDIRAIRRQLGLSQVEAGQLIGGGPRAFTKYEAGTVRPSTSVISLLRVLQADPAALATLRGHEPRSIAPGVASPFDVTGQDIAFLPDRTFPQLLRRLLHAEAQAHDLPAEGIQVASNVSATDGGEDGRITWKGGPARTPFLPSRLCQFQLKTGEGNAVRCGKGRLDQGRRRQGHGAQGSRGHGELHHAMRAPVHPKADRGAKSLNPGGAPQSWHGDRRWTSRLSRC